MEAVINPEYPDENPKDFITYYDAEISNIPWTDEHCSICGRIADAFNMVYAHFPVLHCPYRNKPIHYRICSSLCMAKLMEEHKADCDRIKQQQSH